MTAMWSEASRTEWISSMVARCKGRSLAVGVVGLGYVGLPLALAIAGKGFSVIGCDIDPLKAEKISQGLSYIRQIPAETIAPLVKTGLLSATTDFSRLEGVHVIILCVPTPLDHRREPDLTFIRNTAHSLLPILRRGHLVVLESTTYPGTTREVLKPILESSGFRSGDDFFLAYSPEREDPGNVRFTTAAIPKLLGADGPDAMRFARAFYDEIVIQTVPVSSLEVAEAAKLTENVFRAVNIALANELKTVFEAMNIDVWEVIDAAATKPFGYMAFYPGPGLGGHCIPIDPFYLTWRAKEFGIATRFVELAGEINTAMPQRVVDRTIEALSERVETAAKGARVLVVGIAYKKNVDDVRESPALRIIDLLEGRGAKVSFHDPLLAKIPQTREHPNLAGRCSVALSRDLISSFHAAILCTDHDGMDYQLLFDSSNLVVDARNAFFRRGLVGPKVVRV